MTMRPDDPRLTALLLGDVDPDVAAQVAQDPELQAELDSLRGVVDELSLALADETDPADLGERRRQQLHEAFARGPVPGPSRARRVLPWAGAGVSVLAAAFLGFVLFAESEPVSPFVYTVDGGGGGTPPPVQDIPEADRRGQIAQELENGLADPFENGWEAEAAELVPVRPDAMRSRSRPSSSGAFTPKSGNRRIEGRRGGDAAEGEPVSSERFVAATPHDWRTTRTAPVSTFAIDVDTASLSHVRRYVSRGVLPPAGAVRSEELINAFDYDYPAPDDGQPFSVSVDVAETPWNPDTRLVRIGLQGKEIAPEDRPAMNLVFLVDVSGSMSGAHRLPLVKHSLELLTERLGPRDRVAIVTYAGSAQVHLPSTPGDQTATLIDAIGALDAGGSTAGGAGLSLAYQQARAGFRRGGVNRVVLASDGDFNVGMTDDDALVKMIEGEAASGVALSVLGYGMGNVDDHLLEQLADHGDGNYAFIDSKDEAARVLDEKLHATLVTIAKDVKVQVQFNPGQVGAWRQLGYENRRLASTDFKDDTVDGGEIGAGHSVTMLYEVAPAGVELASGLEPSLRYVGTPDDVSGELLTVDVRAKPPLGGASQLWRTPIRDPGTTLAQASADFHFAAGVAWYARLLRGQGDRAEEWADMRATVVRGIGPDRQGRRAALLALLDQTPR